MRRQGRHDLKSLYHATLAAPLLGVDQSTGGVLDKVLDLVKQDGSVRCAGVTGVGRSRAGIGRWCPPPPPPLPQQRSREAGAAAGSAVVLSPSSTFFCVRPCLCCVIEKDVLFVFFKAEGAKRATKASIGIYPYSDSR